MEVWRKVNAWAESTIAATGIASRDNAILASHIGYMHIMIINAVEWMGDKLSIHVYVQICVRIYINFI